VPTLVAAAGEPNVTAKLLTGYQAAGKTFKGSSRRLQPKRLGWPATGPIARKEFFYWTDVGNLAAVPTTRPVEASVSWSTAKGLDVWQIRW